MDSSGNWYNEAVAANVTAPSNKGVVLAVEFTLSGYVRVCDPNEG